MSWWQAGTSMVATTFTADTPLLVAGLVYTQGISGNWIWSAFLPSGMMTVYRLIQNDILILAPQLYSDTRLAFDDGDVAIDG